MKRMKKISVALLMVVMVIFTMCVPVSAATTDMFLIAGNDTPYSQLVDKNCTYTLYASPSNDYYTESGFDSEEDAENVEWSLISGSTTGIQLSESYAEEMESGNYYSCVDVYVSRLANPGCASIMATAENGAYVNYTLILDRNTPSIYNVNYKIYTNSDLSQEPAESGSLTRVSSSYYTGTTNYANVADLTARLYATDVIDNCTITSSSSNGLASYYLDSMDINDVTYSSHSDENYNYYGWQYRVYDSEGDMIPLSEYVGIDDFELSSQQTVVWIYGVYGMVQFPTTL